MYSCLWKKRFFEPQQCFLVGYVYLQNFQKVMQESLKKSCSNNFFVKLCFAQNHKWLNFYYKHFFIKGHFRHTGSTKVSNFVKLNFYHFWPLCNTKNANFAIFHAKKLKFSPQNRCLIFVKTQWSHSFIDYWPLLTTVHHQKCQVCHFSWYRAEILLPVPYEPKSNYETWNFKLFLRFYVLCWLQKWNVI